ncbi:hypothetical protein CMI37_37055 [Candidatus Pacearchaeota archaeon]|nr:hypothetical protein [Candidatus Pacearchaeota archaeon]
MAYYPPFIFKSIIMKRTRNAKGQYEKERSTWLKKVFRIGAFWIAVVIILGTLLIMEYFV